MRLIMSGTAPIIKISLDDSKSFYENVYKEHANNKQTLSKLGETAAEELSKNGLAQKQHEYKVLASDFMAVVKERKVPIETVLNSLGVADETWAIWRQSVNAGSKITPVTFNNAIVYKMSAMVLKDLVLKHLEEKGLTEYNPDVLKTVISNSKARLEVNSSALNGNFNGFDDKPTPDASNSVKNKIKP
jgi:hypothetical protein